MVLSVLLLRGPRNGRPVLLPLQEPQVVDIPLLQGAVPGWLRGGLVVPDHPLREGDGLFFQGEASVEEHFRPVLRGNPLGCGEDQAEHGCHRQRTLFQKRTLHSITPPELKVDVAGKKPSRLKLNGTAPLCQYLDRRFWRGCTT